jgi:hypothetical protein
MLKIPPKGIIKAQGISPGNLTKYPRTNYQIYTQNLPAILNWLRIRTQWNREENTQSHQMVQKNLFYKIQNPFMVKILQKQGIKKNFFILVGNKNC